MNEKSSSNNLAEINKPIVYAGFWSRVVASLVDGFILAIANFILDKLLFSGWFWIKWALPLGYVVGFNSSTYQGTIGKIIVGIKIMDLYGKRISIKRALARFCFLQLFSIFLLLCGIYWWAGALANNTLETSIAIGLFFIILLVVFVGLLMTVFTTHKQALHDIVCGTLVVRSGQRVNFLNHKREPDEGEKI